MKISVVIPVYNTEKYLRQCVESVLNQTYIDLQVILVDDGSKDSSGNICDELAKKDNRIEVIHKENGGHSDARNTGINRSTGEYVLFLDSDDYWDDNKALERLIGQLKETDCDVLNFQYKKYFEDTDEFEKNKNDIEFSNEIFARGKDAQFEFLINNSLYIASACNKMIRTSLLKNNDMFFEKGVLAEDIEWSARLAISANTMWYCNECFYVYRQRKQSTTHSLTIRNISDVKNHIVRCVQYGENCENSFKKIYLNYVAYQYAVIFVSSGYVKDKELKRIYKELKPYTYLLDYCVDSKVSMMRKVYKLLGYRGLILVGKLYAKIRK